MAIRFSPGAIRASFIVNIGILVRLVCIWNRYDNVVAVVLMTGTPVEISIYYPHPERRGS